MQKVPKCINNILATQVCINYQCNRPNPFICGANHICQQQHITCETQQWTVFKETLNQQKKKINPIFQSLCDKVQKVIFKGIEELKLEWDNFKKWINSHQVIKDIIKFYQSIQLDKEVEWTGKDIYQLRNDILIKFDNIILDVKRIESVLKEIETDRSQFINMNKRLYEIQKPINIIKMQSIINESKQKQLYYLIKKLEEINQSPEHLELKFEESFKYSIQQSNFEYQQGINKTIMQACNQLLSQQSIQKCTQQMISVAIILQNCKFYRLKTLKIYFSTWILCQELCYDKICTSLMKLPKLELFTAIVSSIESDASFKPLGNRFKAMINPLWINYEKWQ